MRTRLALGGLVSALALSFAPQAAAESVTCDVKCRVIELTTPFFCIRGFSC